MLHEALFVFTEWKDYRFAPDVLCGWFQLRQCHTGAAYLLRTRLHFMGVQEVFHVVVVHDRSTPETATKARKVSHNTTEGFPGICSIVCPKADMLISLFMESRCNLFWNDPFLAYCTTRKSQCWQLTAHTIFIQSFYRDYIVCDCSYVYFRVWQIDSPWIKIHALLPFCQVSTDCREYSTFFRLSCEYI